MQGLLLLLLLLLLCGKLAAVFLYKNAKSPHFIVNHVKYSERDPSKSLTLVCETAEFYPGDVTFTWNKDGKEFKTGIHFTEEKNSKELYKASSSMEETQPAQNGAVYTCLETNHIQFKSWE
uniref:Ig-like domain-containing protein n=1 Tax=Callorhinchus milii TaxID=7868 RepID=A0A4W3H1W1_CALMI